MAKPTARAELYTRLSETIGVESAGTLMSYLPGDEPATKADIYGLKSEIGGLRASTKSDIDGLKGEIGGLRASTKADLEAAKSEIMAVLKAEFNAVWAGMSARIDGLENRMVGFEDRLAGFENRMVGFDKRLDVFEGKIDGFHGALLTQTRHFMLAIVGATFSIIAVVVTAG